jgi:hypothetical protein
MKYTKFNAVGKVLLEKEGEILIENDSFVLKGKGATDIGETFSFADIKEWRAKKEEFVFTTVSKEKFILSKFAGLFDDFIKDFVKARNEFLIKALFMDDGEYLNEFDADFEIFSKYDKSLSKGSGVLRLFEKSIVIVPHLRDAFCISLNFLKRVDIDDEFYEITLFLDQGFKIHFTRLGNVYDEFKEKLLEIQQVMYTKTVDEMKDILYEFDTSTFIKLAVEMKRGKAVNEKVLDKIDKELVPKMKEVILHDELAQKHFDYFSKIIASEEIYYGISPDPPAHQPNGKEVGQSSWFFVGLPEKNCVVAVITNGGYRGTYFFKIIMEKGDPFEKVGEKLLEINQALLKLKFVTTPFYKDKRELKTSIYRFALRKLPYLRLLRRSFIGRITPFNELEWDKRITDIFNKAQL